MLTALRRIPVPLLVAMVGGFVVSAVSTVQALMGAGFSVQDSAHEVLLWGSREALEVLAIVGLAWLGHRLSGRARIGARVAMFAAVAQLVCTIAWPVTILYVVTLRQYSAPPAALVYSGSFGPMACLIAITFGLGVATRRWWRIGAATLLTIVQYWPWQLAQSFISRRTFDLIRGGSGMLRAVVVLAIVIVVCRDVAPSDEPAPIARALPRSARSLYALAFATALFIGASLWVSAAVDHAMPWLAHTVVEACQLACLVAFAFGGLLAVRGPSELPAWVVVGSSTIALAIAGDNVMRVGVGTQLLFDLPRPQPFRLSGVPLVFSMSAQLLLALAIAALLVAIAVGARRRGLEHLSTRVLLRAGAFAVLALGAITVQQDLGPDELGLTLLSTPLEGTLYFASAAAQLAAWLLAARTIGNSGDLADGQFLPTAKVIR